MIREWYKLKQPRKLITPETRAAKAPHSTRKYDAIIAGGGPAGLTAAYFMAKQNLDVLLLERGSYPGAKNCGGYSLIAEHTHKLFPNFWDECTCERTVTDQSYWLMTEDSVITASFRSMKLAAAPFNRFTVKRTNLYGWLAAKAADAGAAILFEHPVTEIIFDNDQAVGVKTAPPSAADFAADIIVLADGANSLLAERAHLAPRVSAVNMSLFVKETIALGADTIEQRFNLPPGHGAIIGLFGYPTAGFNGSASIHTFKDSININVGMAVDSFAKSGIRPCDLLERIKNHPHIKPLIAGGETIEYGGQMIPEGGYYAMPKLVHPGLMIIGDAASLVNGVHGINLAMWSAYYAAQAAYQAKITKNFSEKKLSLYQTLLNESFVMQDLKANAGVAKMQLDLPYLFDTYIKMANEAAYHIAKVYTMPKKAKRKYIFKKVISIQPALKTAKDLWKVFKVIR